MNRIILLSAALVACTGARSAGYTETDLPQAASPLERGQAEAIFASGCFWCSESDFEKVEGVVDAVSGYAGGPESNPTYKQVSSGTTGHTEALRVIYDPKVVSYEELLDYFWHHVDPFDGGGQFCDRGSQYRPAIFPVDKSQQKAAERSRSEIAKRFDMPIAVELETPGTFWVAEEYHQDFYKKNPGHYLRYRTGCGRDARVRAIWSSRP